MLVFALWMACRCPIAHEEIDDLKEKIRYLQTELRPSEEKVSRLRQVKEAAQKRLKDIEKI